MVLLNSSAHRCSRTRVCEERPLWEEKLLLVRSVRAKFGSHSHRTSLFLPSRNNLDVIRSSTAGAERRSGGRAEGGGRREGGDHVR